jgi:hypothetical protein
VASAPAATAAAKRQLDNKSRKQNCDLLSSLAELISLFCVRGARSRPPATASKVTQKKSKGTNKSHKKTVQPPGVVALQGPPPKTLKTKAR